MVTNYGTLTGSTVAWINALPWLLVVAAAAARSSRSSAGPRKAALPAVAETA